MDHEEEDMAFLKGACSALHIFLCYTSYNEEQDVSGI